MALDVLRVDFRTLKTRSEWSFRSISSQWVKKLTWFRDENGKNWDPPTPQDLAGKEETGIRARLRHFGRWCGAKRRMCLMRLKEWPKKSGSGKAEEEEVGNVEETDNVEEDEKLEKAQLREKWKELRKPVIPKAIFKDIDYAPGPGKRLAERFAKSGLQIIVKIASMELTPDKPEIPKEIWHVSSFKSS